MQMMPQVNLHDIVEIKARSQSTSGGGMSWVSVTILASDEDECEIAIFSAVPKHQIWAALLAQAINDAQARYKASLVEVK